jgi:hypothetical protein
MRPGGRSAPPAGDHGALLAEGAADERVDRIGEISDLDLYRFMV